MSTLYFINDKARASIEIELKTKEKGPELSICGTLDTDYFKSAGQCIDDIAEYFPKKRIVQRIKTLWEKYHLNDMRAGCKHQRAAGWSDRRIKPEELPNTHANRDERGIIATWVRKDEHPEGLLCEPCPVCGYKYGSAWLYEPIPGQVLREIKDIMGRAENGN